MVLKVNSMTALKGIVVPEVAATDVAKVAIIASTIVPSEPYRTLKVLTFAAVEVQVPNIIILYVEPIFNEFTGITKGTEIIVSAVFIAPDGPVVTAPLKASVVTTFASSICFRHLSRVSIYSSTELAAGWLGVPTLFNLNLLKFYSL